MERKRYRKLNLSHISHTPYCFSLLFLLVCILFSISSAAATCQKDISCSLSGEADNIIFQAQVSARDTCLVTCEPSEPTSIIKESPQEIAEKRSKENMGYSVDTHGVPLSIERRFLSGPGSSPPQCTSKCGDCTPCTPVHVTVPPGTPVTAEYYPEAWRCKCGNKLYMP